MKEKKVNIIGIGASAGGLDALKGFFQNMPLNHNIAFVVIQHLSPDYKSLMGELLSKYTEYRVLEIKDKIEVIGGHIYLIPSRKNVIYKDGKLNLEESRPHHKGLNLPINIFFNSLATGLKDRSIGIILSGTGSDGTNGIKSIKEMGGMVIAQDPFEAKFDGMPRSAISTGIVDFIIKLDKIPDILLKYLNNPFIKNSPIETKILTQKEDIIKRILQIIFDKTKADFSHYKKKTIIRRIEKRIGIKHLNNLEEYLNYIYRDENEVYKLYDELLIGVTNFFRDPIAFEVLQKKVIPEIISSKNDGDEIRIWTTGCSTGEEAYSIAILFKEQMIALNRHISVKVFATDIDKKSIETASKGVYSKNISVDIPSIYMDRYFELINNEYKVKKSIREMIVFAEHNIIKDPPFNRIDLLSCRNLLIYFEVVLQKKVLSIFNFSLKSDGFLFLGKSETIGDLQHLFTPYDQKYKIFRVNKKDRSLVVSDNFHNFSPSTSRVENIDTPNYNKEIKKKKEKEYLTSLLLKNHVPPCIIVNEDGVILHVYGNITKFFNPFVGEVEFKIGTVFSEDLFTILSVGINKVLKQRERVAYKNIKIIKENKLVNVDIKINPLNFTKNKNRYFEIIFDENFEDTEISEKYIEITESEKKELIITNLEDELLYTKETLQTTLEELETSNEELQATNEELLASNEELQSTNEELQSVNEELLTINAEYQMKIDELSTLNYDIDNLLKSTQIGTIFLDENLMIRKFTPAATSEINLIDSDIGRPFTHISHNLVYNNLTDNLKQVLSTLIPIEQEVKNKNNDYFLMRIFPFVAEKREVKGLVITFIKITDLKKAQSIISLNQNMLENIFENSPIGICITNKDGIFEKINSAYSKFYGYSKEELIGQHFTKIVPDNSKKELTLLHDRFMIDKMELVGEWEVSTKNGQKTILANASYITGLDGDGKKVTFIVDISDKKIFENKLKNAVKLAEENSKYKSMFLANMSHEIKTPLNGISGFLSILHSTDLSQEQKEYLLYIDKSVENLKNIIDDILDISKIESNKLKFENKTTTISVPFKEIISFYQHSASQKGIELIYIENLSKNYQFLLDKNRLKQIIGNLVSNAIKFTNKGKVVIEVTDLIKDNHKVNIQIVVKDTGIGMDKEELKNIFDAFVQGDISIKKRYQGTGLGLTITKKLVELFDGNISVKSKKGEGSSFIINIPFFISNKNNIETENYLMSDKKVLLIDIDNSTKDFIDQLDPEITFLKFNDFIKNSYNLLNFDLIFINGDIIDDSNYDDLKDIDIYKLNNDIKTPIISILSGTNSKKLQKLYQNGVNLSLISPINQDDILKILKFFV